MLCIPKTSKTHEMRTERGAAALTEIIVNAAAPLDCLREDFQSEEGINLTQQNQYH